MPEKKFYVVWKGIKPGIYDNWKECELQVKGVEGAVYKSFPDPEQARQALLGDWKDYMKKKVSKIKISNVGVGNPVLESISVDAACSGNPGIMEYQGVDTRSGIRLFHKGPFSLGTNNLGEFLGIVHALAYLHKIDSLVPVYTDSRTALKWLKEKTVKTKLPRDAKTEALFELIDRALVWLNTHEYQNAVLKWDTENWGEIPADFGRK